MSDRSAFADLVSIAPLKIWDGLVARAVEGERLTFTVIELDAGSVVPEHSHENEQVGVLVQGSLTFRVGGETRTLEPGGTWRVNAHVPHLVETGPEGAVVVEVFSPVRRDWEGLEVLEPRRPLWP